MINLFTINTDGLPIAGALWFLTALFFTTTIYFILDKYKIKLIIIPLVFIGLYANNILPFTLPLALGPAFVGLGLYWIGNIIKTNEQKLSPVLDMKIVPTVILSFISVGIIIINGYVNMKDGLYAIMSLFWVNAIFAIIILISVSKHIERHLFFSKEFLAFTGRNSFVFMCLNQLYILIFRKVYSFLGFSVWLDNTFMFVSTVIGLYITAIVFANTKLRVILGKYYEFG